MRVYIYIYTYTFILCIYIYIYVCIYIYIYIHTRQAHANDKPISNNPTRRRPQGFEMLVIGRLTWGVGPGPRTANLILAVSH